MILIYIASVLFSLLSFRFFDGDPSIGDEPDSRARLIVAMIPAVNILAALNQIRTEAFGSRCCCGSTAFGGRRICDSCESRHMAELEEFYKKRLRQ